MEGIAQQSGFNNIQLEFLKLYARPVSNDDLEAIKKLIANYFAQKAMDEADKFWKERGYDAETILKKHLRTPYEIEQ